MLYKVAIIGGGFSGLCAAVKIGKVFGQEVLILEGNKRIGKKILSTGNGQGNLTNLNMSHEFYHGDVEFAKRGLSKYTNVHLLEFFEDLGLITDVRENKVYPASFVAGSILDVLRFELERLNVSVLTEKYVVKITKEKNFKIECKNGEVFFAKKVILAFGGKSGAGFMTDGTSYPLALSFGHTLTTLSPSLVQLKVEKEKIKGLKGIKQEVRAMLLDGEKEKATFIGDLLFTDYGVSGNTVFSLSAYHKNCKNPRLILEFLPNLRKDDLIKKLKAKCKNGVTMEKLLISVLPSRLILTLLKDCNYQPTQIARESQVEDLVEGLKNFILKIEGTAGFDNSQVTAGGISTKEITDFMQSKIVAGLYIIGEALNVDGDCGGYNLQWAFTSASLAAEDILSEAN